MLIILDLEFIQYQFQVVWSCHEIQKERVRLPRELSVTFALRHEGGTLCSPFLGHIRTEY
jgi:hypothetical protein